MVIHLTQRVDHLAFPDRTIKGTHRHAEGTKPEEHRATIWAYEPQYLTLNTAAPERSMIERGVDCLRAIIVPLASSLLGKYLHLGTNTTLLNRPNHVAGFANLHDLPAGKKPTITKYPSGFAHPYDSREVLIEATEMPLRGSHYLGIYGLSEAFHVANFSLVLDYGELGRSPISAINGPPLKDRQGSRITYDIGRPA